VTQWEKASAESSLATDEMPWEWLLPAVALRDRQIFGTWSNTLPGIHPEQTAWKFLAAFKMTFTNHLSGSFIIKIQTQTFCLDGMDGCLAN